MSQEFNEEFTRSRERRSRKNPKLRAADESAGAGFDPRREALRQTSAASTKDTGERSPNGLPVKAEVKIKQVRRKRRIIAMIVAECFALMFIFAYGFVARKMSQIQRPKFEQSEVQNTNLTVDTVEKMKGYWTIAIFGVDARGKEIDKYTNADVNMICNINMDTGEIRLVSVFRDTYLNIDEKSSYNKLNKSYFDGGPQQAVSALNRNLDLDITHFVTFNWKAVADAINILGGIDVELSRAEYSYINSFITETVKVTGIGSKHLTHDGLNHLDGVQAVAYGRLRLMDTDYARTERQRKIIALAFDKAKEADIGVLNNIAEVVFEQVATNIELKDIIHMALNISKYHLGETTGFPMARGDVRMGTKGLVVVPQTLESNVVQLHQFLFGDENYTTTATVKKISAKIAEDSGMYKEGKAVNGVSTDNGAKQSAKQTAGETMEDETKVKSESDGYGKSTGAGSEAELSTDEYGNIIEETPGIVRPGESTVSTETTQPGSTAATTTVSPGSTAATTAVSPGNTAETTAAGPGGTTGTTASAGPGGSAGTTETTAVTPGSTTETTVSNIGPGSTETTGSVDSTTVPALSDSSGETVGSAPGSQNSETPTIFGPGV